MFQREHHQRIARVLGALRIENLVQCGTLFGEGTALVLQLGEYRESVDVGFLCGSIEDYSRIRRGIYDQGNAFLFRESTKVSRELVQGRSEMRAAIDLEDGQRPVKFEILSEGYLGGLRPSQAEVCGAPCLHPQDAMAMKLMANADRGLDSTHQFRDLIDLLVAARTFGPLSVDTLKRVRVGYSTTAEDGLLKTVRLLQEQPVLLQTAAKALAVDATTEEYLKRTIHSFDASLVIETAK
jgi:hypothetical protein